MKKLLPFILILIAAPCFGGANNYKCIIENFYGFDDIGDSSWAPESDEWFKGSFHVDRYKGIIVGDHLQNTGADSIKVVDIGSSEQAFKLISIFYLIGIEGRNVNLLRINEFVKKPKKPFYASHSLGIFTGTCK